MNAQASPTEEEVFAFPASFAQQRLWFLEQMEPLTPTYNVPQAVRLQGPLDAALLERCLQEIVDRHESLRTTFSSPDGEPMQVVSSRLELRVPVDALEHLPEQERLAEAMRRAQAEAARPFDLTRGPLVRAGLLRLGETDHVLWLVVHHIVCDGWSLASLYRELSALYRAFGAGEPSPLPEVPIQYADYSLWQRELFQGERLDAELGHWRHALSGGPPALELPTDRPRPPTQTTRGAQRTFHVSRSVTDAIAALARAEGASLFQTLLAAFQVLLHRLSHGDEILVGSPVANRDRAEIEAAIGFYTNTVVFRGDLSGAPTFRGLLGKTRETVLSALAHQDVPFEKVVEAVHPGRGSTFNPLFQAMFALQRAPESALDLPGISAELWNVHPGTSKFDVLLEMQEVSSGMQCFFEYNTDLFDDARAVGMIASFETLLAAIIADPDRSIAELEIVPEADRKQLLETWNATELDVPAACAHELVAEQAQRTPDAIALEFGAERVSYAELDRRANQLAHRLRDLDLDRDAKVGVFVERSIEMVVAILAIGKAGAAYLPLDPAYPADRVGYMLSDARAAAIVSRRAEAASLPPHGARLVLLDEERAALDALPGSAPPNTATPESLAYVIYTSGSTGKPKGVCIPHRALTNFLVAMRARPGIQASDRLLAVTTLSFDIAGLELWLPLSVGATVIIADRELAGDGAELSRALEERRVTMMQATPATWRLLLDADWTGSPGLKVLCGGEALPPRLAEQLLERCGELWNMYGPTETTIWSTCERVTNPAGLTIGTPIGNTSVYILDPNKRPVPIGVVGDLYIGGSGVAGGYLDRPELTSERFVPDPWKPGARMYMTGDRARFQRDGRIEFLGRADNQVKVRGFRIELGEIESALSKHPAIERTVVVVRDDPSGDKRLVAYCVYAGGEEPTASEQRKFLRSDLPEYMVPHLFVALAAIPLTSNGKIDRRALPDPLADAMTTSHDHAPPATPTEQTVAEIWRGVLHSERVGRHDNFFELGGHSLSSMQAIVRLHRATGHRLNPRSMAYQTLEQIAAECDAARAPRATAANDTSATVAASPRPSPSQARSRRDEGAPLASTRGVFGALKRRLFG